MTTTPPTAPDPGEPPALTPRQRELYDALVDLDRSGKLARMYLGAVLVRGQPGNPDAVALSAHGIRELMEKLPAHLDVPMVQRVTSQLGGMVERFKSMAVALPAQRDNARAKFYLEAERFAGWYVGVRTERMKRAGEVIDKLDQRQASLPQPIKQPHIDMWNDCLKIVETAAHHGTVTLELYDEHVQKVEDFLLDRLRPRTVQDQDVLRNIAREGEAHA